MEKKLNKKNVMRIERTTTPGRPSELQKRHAGSFSVLVLNLMSPDISKVTLETDTMSTVPPNPMTLMPLIYVGMNYLTS